MKFYYQIKRQKTFADECRTNFYTFPPEMNGVIESDTKEQARQKLCEEYGYNFKEQVRKKDLADNPFLICIEEFAKYHERLYEIQECKMCGTKFRIIDLYNDQHATSKGGSFCSDKCKSEYYDAGVAFERGFNVIYAITQKSTGMKYIGQTTQSFTLRWWQHVKNGVLQASQTKFYQAMKASGISDWAFEVIERIEDPKQLNEREQFWIEHFDSIENGFNSRPQLTNKKGKNT